MQTVPYLSSRWLPDESWYAAPGLSIARGNGVADPAIGANDIENQFDARPPGTAIVISGAFRLFGTSQVSARLGSILAGVSVIFLTFYLALDQIGPLGAIVATFVVATDNLVVLTSRTARPDIFTVAAALASLLAINQYGRKGSAYWAVSGGLLMAVGTVFHITLFGYLLSCGVLVIVIDAMGGKSILKGGSSFLLGYTAGLVPFVAWIFGNPLGVAGFREEYLQRATGAPMLSRFLQEGHRYSDLLGFNMVSFHDLESFPVRFPLPFCFLGASLLLWKMRRDWFYLELLLFLPTLLWFIASSNKSSRYLALVAPLIALVFGAAVASIRSHRGWCRTALLVCAAITAAQLSANVYLLYRAREANYTSVEAKLREMIPPGKSVYGSISFWLALHDHSFISYERTDPMMAANRFHAQYFIAGDRVLTQGTPGDEQFFDNLRSGMAQVIARSVFVGQISDPYYGQLMIYKIRMN